MKHMKMTRKMFIDSLLIALLSLTMIAGMALSVSKATDSNWNIDFMKTAGNSSLGYAGYRSMQGIGFDTYSGKDGYEFVQSEDEKTYALVHFTMDDKGWVTKQKEVIYSISNVGHANDATVYKDENGKKWLFFAAFGTMSETLNVKASDGTALKLGVISLDDFAKGTKRVYSCNVNVSPLNSNIVGVTYAGKKFVQGEEVPVFIIYSGQTVYETTLEQSNGKMTLNWTGERGSFTKPKIADSDANPAATQGITYHNGYVYICAESTKADNHPTHAVVMRAATDGLFNSNTDLEVFIKDLKKMDGESETFAKNGPEAVFFTSLNAKSNIYVGANRLIGSTDADAIMRSAVRY